jgi:hypothetical protein
MYSFIGDSIYILSAQGILPTMKKKVKSVENYKNQLLKSGDFSSGEKQQNQEV